MKWKYLREHHKRQDRAGRYDPIAAFIPAEQKAFFSQFSELARAQRQSRTKPAEDKEKRAFESTILAGGTLITHVTPIPDGSGCVAVITKSGTGSELWVVRGIQDLHTMVGKPVTLCRAEKKLALPDGTTIEMIELKGVQSCLRGHGTLRTWESVPRCWTCGWPFK
jgi:hypothetical protein